jgi:hypothetical protein
MTFDEVRRSSYARSDSCFRFGSDSGRAGVDRVTDKSQLFRSTATGARLSNKYPKMKAKIKYGYRKSLCKDKKIDQENVTD